MLLFQGVMLVLMLGVALAGAAAGDPVLPFGIGLMPILLVAGLGAVRRGNRQMAVSNILGTNGLELALSCRRTPSTAVVPCCGR